MKTPLQSLNTTNATGTITVEYYFSKDTDAQPGVVDLHCTFRDESRSATVSLKEAVSRKAVKDGSAAAQVIGEMISEYFSVTPNAPSAIPPTV